MLIFPHQSGGDDKEERSGHKLFLTGRMANLDNFTRVLGTGVIIEFFRKLARSAAGATAVEYGLIVSLIVIAAMAAIMSLADTTIGMWNDVASNVLAH